MNSMRAEYKYLKAGSSVVNYASVAALYGQPTYSAYGAAKSGVVTLTKTAARDYGAQGIRCNAVLPGPIETPLFRLGIDQKQFTAEGLSDLTCLKRVGQPFEVAQSVKHSLSLSRLNEVVRWRSYSAPRHPTSRVSVSASSCLF
jgi:NAD(P)-dependent dehydrogenase (short-subunit alcohol dehydrogenase family)